MRSQAHRPAFVLKLPMRRLCALCYSEALFGSLTSTRTASKSASSSEPKKGGGRRGGRREEGGRRKKGGKENGEERREERGRRREQGGGRVRREEGGGRRKGRIVCKASLDYAPGCMRQRLLSSCII